MEVLSARIFTCHRQAGTADESVYWRTGRVKENGVFRRFFTDHRRLPARRAVPSTEPVVTLKGNGYVYIGLIMSSGEAYALMLSLL